MSTKRTVVAIFGSNGFLGSNLVATAPHGLKIHRVPREIVGVDSRGSRGLIDKKSLLSREISESNPQIVINCAALADVDACEKDHDLAFELNCNFPRRLAQVCSDHGTQLIHISTDAVFGGSDGPFGENHLTSPINVYGRSKAAGEDAVLEADDSALVVRTNIYGWSPTGSRSLFEYFFNRLSVGVEAPGFTDVQFRPLSVMNLWPALITWRSDVKDSGTGRVRHATGAELITKYEFGRRIAKHFGYETTLVVPASVNSSELLAQRAQVLDLLPSRISNQGSVVEWPPHMAESLAALDQANRNGYRSRLASFAVPSQETADE